MRWPIIFFAVLLSAPAWAQVQPTPTNPVTPQASVNGGLTNYSAITPGSSAPAVSVVTGVHQLYELSVSNGSAAVACVRLFDLATTPTVGTSTPARRYSLAAGGNLALNFDGIGLAFANGIAYDVTGEAVCVDNGNTNAPAGVNINLGYK